MQALCLALRCSLFKLANISSANQSGKSAVSMTVIMIIGNADIYRRPELISIKASYGGCDKVS